MPTNFPLNFSIRSLNLTAPSSSREIDAPCRINVIMNCDPAKQPWLNVSGLMSIHTFTNRNRNEGQCHSKLWSWLGLRYRFPCTDKFNAFNRNFFWRFCDMFIDSIHNANPWYCLVFKQGFNDDIHTVTSLMEVDLHIQDPADFHVSTNPSSCSGCFLISRKCVLSTWCLHIIRPFCFKCNEELSFPNIFQETRIRAWFG